MRLSLQQHMRKSAYLPNHYSSGHGRTGHGRCWYFLLSVLLLLGGQQRLGELVRAGRGLRAAADALQAGDQLIDIHTLGQPATPCVLPLQPPIKRTFETLLPSSSNKIWREQTPCGV